MDIRQLSVVILNMHGHNGDMEGFLHVVRIADDCLTPRVAVPRVLVDFEGTPGSNQADKPWDFAATGGEGMGGEGRGGEGRGGGRGGEGEGEGGGRGGRRGGRGRGGEGEGRGGGE